MKWLQLFNMNHVTAQDRDRFLARLRQTLGSLPK
jgi:hypothetical protein